MDNKQAPRRSITRRQLLKQGLRYCAAASLSSSLWLDCCSPKQPRKKPNIILITIDTLRADHLHCYGYFRDTSPNLNKFAQESLLFENCLSHAPVTNSSCASMLSGFLPHETRVFENHPLPPTLDTLPKMLRRKGYVTAAVVSNFNLRREAGWMAGFTFFDDTMGEKESVRGLPERIAENTTNRAIELLDQNHQDKLFLWVHYQDPHGPYTPPGKFATWFVSQQQPRYLRLNETLSGQDGIPSYQKLQEHRDYYHYVAQYDGEIRYQDEHFKRLWGALKKYRWYEDALIIITSDHGEGMGERDYYFAHGENLYRNQIHVPLVFKFGRKLTGTRADMVQHIDIVPTVLKIVGGETDSPFRGRDLRYPQGPPREIFAEMDSSLIEDGVKRSIIWDGLKLIYTSSSKKYELFDLRKDPSEIRDLTNIRTYRKQADDLKNRLNHIAQEDLLHLEITTEPPSVTEEEKEKLRSLGYVQ